ncbi:MAG: RNA polymerase sigma factor [Bacteroidia bacterium]
MSDEKKLIPELFKKEFSKMVAVISKLFGLQHMGIAEDIVSETFLLATETWGTKGIPENPSAWLYAVAKQKTLYHFRRDKIFYEKVAPAVIASHEIETEAINPDFSEENIKDSQLQMLFAICDPSIASEAQIGLALRILCGFGIEEIAEAFLTNKETINKRLFRAKEKLRVDNIKLELPSEKEINIRLDNVLHCIYLLFNEGYYSTTQNKRIRKGMCLEAFRLGLMLGDFPKTNVPKTNALLALFSYHSSRFTARDEENNSFELYDQQNKDLWDADLISQGNYFLDLSAHGNEISSYHLEARIAYWHCHKDDKPEKWRKILDCYNQLLLVNYSPIAALNRTYALYKVVGNEAAIIEAEKLNLENNQFYHTLLGELYKNVDKIKAVSHFKRAILTSKSAADKQILQAKIDETI